MPRYARLDAPDTLHHVMIRGIEKRRIANDRKDKQDFVTRLGELASESQMKIYAWALMPNHAHILLRSGPYGLSKFMRRFLTGYAIRYNLRHRRHGHLFQNRYKSIVCDEDAYFTELVRYIHLNPLRGRLVKDISELETYPWCGHSTLMGKKPYDWHDCDFVLSWFGKRKRQAQRAYCRYVAEGIEHGKRPELVGGGLVRSLGGWSQVISLRRHGDRELSDERILGRGEFVERVIEEADERLKYQLPVDERREKISELIQQLCASEKINSHELASGSRRRLVSKARSRIAQKLVKTHGVPLAEVARRVGVSTSAVSKIISKTEK